nr:YraN family protein [Bifidobacterium sp. DSM 109957]
MDLIAADMREPGLSARRFGMLGEAYAVAWLEARGWQTLSRNWRTRFGELDIVMMTPDQLIVFVEVKARRYAKYGVPQEAVTADKQRKLRLAASSWLLDRRNRAPHHGVRFDVMSITLGETQPNVRHIAGAF